MLNNVKSSDGVLIALDDHGVAVSRVIDQKQRLNDFRTIQIKAYRNYLKNIYDPNKNKNDNDKIINDYEFKVGQELIIKVIGRLKQFTITEDTLKDNVVDVSSVTNGLIPTDIYIKNKCFINGIEPVEKSIEFIYMDNLKMLFTYSKFEDLTIPYSRTLQTKIELPVKGNYMEEIVMDKHQTKLKSAIPTQTENSDSIISSDNVKDDAYKVFDGKSESAYSIACDSEGVVDIFHTFKFEEKEQILALKILCNKAENSPQEITLSGSDDNSEFTELIKMKQEIVIDDFEISKRLDIENYKPYQYYKIHVTKGPKDKNVSVNEYYLMKEV